LSDEILKISINFCDRTHEISNDMHNYYYEHFTSTPTYKNLTKQEFIVFFNILYSTLYDKGMEQRVNQQIPIKHSDNTIKLPTFNAIKLQIMRKSSRTIKIVRSSVISAFLEAFYLNTNDDERNVIDIHEWARCSFSDTQNFYLVTLNAEFGYYEFRDTKKRGKKQITPLNSTSSSEQKSSNDITSSFDDEIISSNDLFEDLSPPSDNTSGGNNVPIVSQDDNYDENNDQSNCSAISSSSSAKLQIEFSPPGFVFSADIDSIALEQQFDIFSPPHNAATTTKGGTTPLRFSKTIAASPNTILNCEEILKSLLEKQQSFSSSKNSFLLENNYCDKDDIVPYNNNFESEEDPFDNYEENPQFRNGIISFFGKDIWNKYISLSEKIEDEKLDEKNNVKKKLSFDDETVDEEEEEVVEGSSEEGVGSEENGLEEEEKKKNEGKRSEEEEEKEKREKGLEKEMVGESSELWKGSSSEDDDMLGDEKERLEDEDKNEKNEEKKDNCIMLRRSSRNPSIIAPKYNQTVNNTTTTKENIKCNKQKRKRNSSKNNHQCSIISKIQLEKKTDDDDTKENDDEDTCYSSKKKKIALLFDADHELLSLLLSSFCYPPQQVMGLIKFEDIPFFEDKFIILSKFNNIDGKEEFKNNQMFLMDISDFIMPMKRDDCIQAISLAVDHDINQCIMKNKEGQQKNRIVTTKKRILMSNNRYDCSGESIAFSFSLFQKILSILLNIGVITERFSDLRSSDGEYGEYGLDLAIDFPFAGEDSLTRVADFYHNKSQQFKKHTLIFNHTLEVNKFHCLLRYSELNIK
jgi:hypothetical protein